MTPRVRFLALALFVFHSRAGAADPPAYTIEMTTRDGNTIVGVSEVVELKVETSLGTFDVKIENVVTITFQESQLVVRLREGTTIQGKAPIASWKVKSNLGVLDVKVSQISLIRVVGVVAAATPSPHAPAPGAGDVTPSASEPEMKPDKTLRIEGPVPAIRCSPDRSMLYILTQAPPKVLAVQADSLEVKHQIEVPESVSASIPPSGKVLVVAGKKKVTLIDLGTHKISKSFEIEMDIFDAVAVDDQTVYASVLLAGNLPPLQVISLAKQGVVRSIGGGVPGLLHLTSDGKKIYSQTGAVLLEPSGPPVKGQMFEPRFVQYSYMPYGNLWISPDDRFAVASNGHVFRLGRSYLADMLPYAGTESPEFVVFLPRSNRLLLFTPMGFMKEYAIGSFELLKSTSLGLRASAAIADENGKGLYLFGSKSTSYSPNVPVNPYYTSAAMSRSFPRGQIYKFALPDRSGGDAKAEGGKEAPVVGNEPAPAAGGAPAPTAPPAPGTGAPPTPPAPAVDTAEKECAKWLLFARNYYNQRDLPRAEENAKRVIEKCPQGKHAEEAREILGKIAALK